MYRAAASRQDQAASIFFCRDEVNLWTIDAYGVPRRRASTDMLRLVSHAAQCNDVGTESVSGGCTSSMDVLSYSTT